MPPCFLTFLDPSKIERAVAGSSFLASEMENKCSVDNLANQVVIGERAGLNFVQLTIARSQVKNGKPQTTVEHVNMSTCALKAN